MARRIVQTVTLVAVLVAAMFVPLLFALVTGIPPASWMRVAWATATGICGGIDLWLIWRSFWRHSKPSMSG